MAHQYQIHTTSEDRALNLQPTATKGVEVNIYRMSHLI